MKRFLLFAALLVAVVPFSACDNGESDPLVMTIYCSNSTPKPAQNIYFDIKAFTTDGADVTALKIISFDAEFGENVLLDKSFDQKSIEHKFQYQAPVFADKKVDVEMKFVVRSSSGNSLTLRYYLTVAEPEEETPQPDEGGTPPATDAGNGADAGAAK